MVEESNQDFGDAVSLKYDIEELDELLQSISGKSFTDEFKNNTLTLFLNKLPVWEVRKSLEIAADTLKESEVDDMLRYFCGICWKKIKTPKTKLSE